MLHSLPSKETCSRSTSRCVNVMIWIYRMSDCRNDRMIILVIVVFLVVVGQSVVSHIAQFLSLSYLCADRVQAAWYTLHRSTLGRPCCLFATLKYGFGPENTQEAVVPQPGRPQLSYRSVIATPQVGTRPDPSVFIVLFCPTFLLSFIVLFCPKFILPYIARHEGARPPAVSCAAKACKHDQLVL